MAMHVTCHVEWTSFLTFSCPCPLRLLVFLWSIFLSCYSHPYISTCLMIVLFCRWLVLSYTLMDADLYKWTCTSVHYLRVTIVFGIVRVIMSCSVHHQPWRVTRSSALAFISHVVCSSLINPTESLHYRLSWCFYGCHWKYASRTFIHLPQCPSSEFHLDLLERAIWKNWLSYIWEGWIPKSWR